FWALQLCGMVKLMKNQMVFCWLLWLFLTACQTSPLSLTASERANNSSLPPNRATEPQQPPRANRPPVITSLSAEPSGQVSRGGVITFAVKASDPDGDSLRLTWGATKGLLSATKGEKVQWRPVRFD